MLKLQEEVGELTQAFLMRTGRARDKDATPEQLQQALRSELADVLCHLLLLARHHDVNLQPQSRKVAKSEPHWISRQAETRGS